MVENRYNRYMPVPASNSNPACSSNNGKSPMERLRAIEFAIVDTALYLDVYPTCKSALEHYHKLIKERNAILPLVSKTYGPLTICDNYDESKWTWVKGPWPWEPDAN